MNASEIALEIVRGNWTREDTDVLVNAIREAQSKRREQERREAQATLRVGLLVEIEDVRPARLVGIQGNIVGFNSGRSRCDIKITRNEAPFASYGERVGDTLRGLPVTCCKQIQPQVRTRTRGKLLEV